MCVTMCCAWCKLTAKCLSCKCNPLPTLALTLHHGPSSGKDCKLLHWPHLQPSTLANISVQIAPFRGGKNTAKHSIESKHLKGC